MPITQPQCRSLRWNMQIALHNHKRSLLSRKTPNTMESHRSLNNVWGQTPYMIINMEPCCAITSAVITTHVLVCQQQTAANMIRVRSHPVPAVMKNLCWCCRATASACTRKAAATPSIATTAYNCHIFIMATILRSERTPWAFS